jgi:general secretion pathway protein G
MKNAYKKVCGFTLVEILVVLAIISVLSSVVMVSVGSARTNAKIKTETATVAQFELYLKLYREQTNNYPPGVDNCSACNYSASSPATIARWKTVADSLTPLFTTRPIYEDEWGNPYAYDNNFRVPNTSYYTYLCSAGPNGVDDSGIHPLTTPSPSAGGDDICFFTR